MVSREKITRFASSIISSLLFFLLATPLFASEADLKIPDLSPAQSNLLYWGFLICILGMLFGRVYVFQGEEDPVPQVHAGCLGDHLPDL